MVTNNYKLVEEQEVEVVNKKNETESEYSNKIYTTI